MGSRRRPELEPPWEGKVGQMGIAQYNRGTRKLSRDLDNASARAFRRINDMNRSRKDPDAQTPDCKRMKVYYCSHFEVWTLENGRVGFWATEKSLWELVRKWHIQIEDFDLNAMTGHAVSV